VSQFHFFDCVEILCDALKVNKTLQGLDLTDNGIEEDADYCARIVSTLEGWNTTLTTLQLKGNFTYMNVEQFVYANRQGIRLLHAKICRQKKFAILE
jgi:hypothetical protein